jgi:hypothetical protein
MTQIDEQIVSELESKLARPTVRFLSQVSEETKKAVEGLDLQNTDITVHATIRRNDVVGVVQVMKVDALDLYGDAGGPMVRFAETIRGLVDLLNTMIATNEDDIDFELRSAEFWAKLSCLNRWIGTSSAHDELISIIQQLISQKNQEPLNQHKIRLLATGFDLLKGRLFLSDDVLDRFHGTLEQGGFDLNYVTRYEV